jgi:hypothetical protein
MSELLQLIMHSSNPTVILQGFIHFLWFELSQIAIVSHLISKLIRGVGYSASEPSTFIEILKKLP